jgi:hypothetical protein
MRRLMTNVPSGAATNNPISKNQRPLLDVNTPIIIIVPPNANGKLRSPPYRKT